MILFREKFLERHLKILLISSSWKRENGKHTYPFNILEVIRETD
jgi:hypothetical protein